MSQTPSSPETTSDQTQEEQVVARARDYDEARQRAADLHRDRIVADEEERLADSDFHAASNDRFAANLTADDRTMGFTGTTEAPSSDGEPVDQKTGWANHRYQVLLEARKRLDVLCDRADRELDEALGALLSATDGLRQVAGEDEESDDVEAFDLVVGGRVDAAVKESDEAVDLTGATSAA